MQVYYGNTLFPILNDNASLLWKCFISNTIGHQLYGSSSIFGFYNILKRGEALEGMALMTSHVIVNSLLWDWLLLLIFTNFGLQAVQM